MSFVLLVFSLFSCGGNKHNDLLGQMPDTVKAISSKFSTAQLEDFIKKTNYTVSTMDSMNLVVPGEHGMGGELTAFYTDFGISKIDAFFKGELGNAYETYFLLGNQLFAYRQIVHKKPDQAAASTEIFEVLFSEGTVLEARVGEGVELDKSNIDYILESLNVYVGLLKAQGS